MTTFKHGPIAHLTNRGLECYSDDRGLLTELFRRDENLEPFPAMGYMSTTYPGQVRGPHEHRHQIDVFAFIGVGDFKFYAWDMRPTSGTYLNRVVWPLGQGVVNIAKVPPGVVHAYKNIGDTNGYVLNFPNMLYRGKGRMDDVDEIRYEDDPDSPFVLED